VADAGSWDGNWAWALPLIVVTVILHIVGLGLINERVVRTLDLRRARGSFLSIFVLVMGVTTLLATGLLALDAGIWAGAYRILGAMPDNHSAMLYSLGAITTYGHAEVFLAKHWRLMGALEALNGVLLFGLTTAFLYGHIQRVWPVQHKPSARNAAG
jgi:hypothetical protein